MKLSTKFQIVYISTKIIEWLFYLSVVIMFVLFVASAGEGPGTILDYIVFNLKLIIAFVISCVIAWFNSIVREITVRGYQKIIKKK